MTKLEGNSKDEVRIGLRFWRSDFVINSSFVIRHSSFPLFVIRHSSFI